ncbi:CHAT domain-containing protein [Pontibacter toksunensis]|uniref:CHAT domain-containing protein n=1 Tax=Pontibacter toksunensis TaxID=1332631 RepID=A0ABW6BTL6_9BACT
MLKLLVKYFLLLTLMPLNQQIQAQCLSNIELFHELKKIEGDAVDENTEKLRKLHQLQSIFLKCNKSKDSTYAQIVHRLGSIYYQSQNIEEAIRFTKEAVSVNKSGKEYADKSFLANSYLNLGTFYSAVYLSEESHQSWNNCISISSQFPGRSFLALVAFEQKSFAYFQTGDYQKSIETAENGISLARKTANSTAEALLLSQKAQAQAELNIIKEAEENIKKAVSILTENSETEMLATSYSVYALILNKKGDTEAAIQYYRKAYDLNKAQAYWAQCSRDMLDLGLLYDNKLQDSQNALACFEQGLEMVDKQNDDNLRAGIYTNMGAVYWREKDFDKALQFYQKALNTFPIQFKDTSIHSNPTLSMLKLASNDYYVSTLLANKAEVLLDKYKVVCSKKLLSSSLKTYLLADKAVDLMRWEQYGEQSKLFWRSNTKKMYEHAIEASYLANNTRLAFFFMEKSRAVLLNDKLNELGAFAKLPPSEMVKEQEFRNRVLTAQQKWINLETETQERETVRAELLEAKNDYENYIENLEKRYPAYYQYKYADDVPSLNTLQQYLALNKASFVHYFINDSASYVLSITPENSRILKLPKDKFNQEQLNRFIMFCSEKQTLNNNFSSFALLSNQLYNTLFKPLQLPEGKVIVCADNFLIPFEAMCTDSRGKRYLIDDYVFSYVYSSRYLLEKFASKPAEGNFIGFAPVHFQPYLQLAELKQAAVSLQQTASYYPSSKLFTEKQATKDNFIQNIAGYSIVNVFSHARADTSKREPMLFMQDSAIRLSELQLSRNMATELVVLSACQTNVGKNATGEGIYSLARGFASAGVPSVAATLWKADEQAIYEISNMFHEYLAQGMRKDDALQKAKLNYVRLNSHEKSLPYYWANMIIMGNSEHINLSESQTDWWWIGLAIVILLGIIFILFRRRLTPKAI